MNDYLAQWSSAIDGAITQGFDTDETPPAASKLIYAFVRMCRPKRLVEFGAFSGFTSACMALGCQHNGEGHVVTYELCPEWADSTRANLAQVLGDETDRWVTVITGDALASHETGVDLLFIDVAPKTLYQRAFEAVEFNRGALLFAHDTNMVQHFAEVHGVKVTGAEDFATYMLAQPDWQTIVLPQNRGLLIAQKL